MSDAAGSWTVVEHSVLYPSIHADRPDGPLALGCGNLGQIAAAANGITALHTADGRVRVYDITAPTARPLLAVRTAYRAFSLSADGKRLLVDTEQQGEETKALSLISVPDGGIVRTFPVSTGHRVQSFAVSSDGTLVAWGSCDWNAGVGCTVDVARDDGTPLYTSIATRNLSPSHLTFSPDGKAIAVENGRSRAHSLLIDDGKVTWNADGNVYGWLDDERLLIANYSDDTMDPTA